MRNALYNTLSSSTQQESYYVLVSTAEKEIIHFKYKYQGKVVIV